MTEALFQYHLRVSPRARDVRLRVTTQRGLEVFVPRGYDDAKVPGLLERKKNRIRAALEQAEARRKFFEPEPVWRLPTEIKLPALGVTWNIRERRTKVRWVAVREIGPSALLVFGNITHERSCRAALSRWLMRQTRRHLVPRLHDLSHRTGERFKRVLVKQQKTRWASCSRHKTISLNVKLLFLPSELLDYVLIHELCHLSEMNHSRDFWHLVRHHCPDFHRRDAQLREMWKRLPRWVFTSD
jgi:predicted metal-dependent hydrolase